MSAPAPEAGDLIAGGKYRLERHLAKGGMGSVYVARHIQLDVPFAIKFIDPAMATSESARARFEREARAAAQIRNPNVVQVFDHGVDAGVPYIVMELLEGEDLGARLRREKRLPLADIASIMTQIAKGLRRAHESGIVHRDLKPGNIFMARVEEEEVVKILDFGLAKALTGDASEDVTVSGMILGSPHYMSPEQAKGGKNLDHRSDLWSLGIILYRCITGVPPFQGDQIGEMVVKICTEPIVPPSVLVPDLPFPLDRFFERALARDPDRRFQTVREMAAQFTSTALSVTRPSIADYGPESRSTPGAMLTPTPGHFARPGEGPPSNPTPQPAPSSPFNGPPSGPSSAPNPHQPPQQPFANPFEGAGTLTKEGTTVLAMTPSSGPKRGAARSSLLAVTAGAAVLGVLGTVGLLSMRTGHSSSATLSTPPSSVLVAAAIRSKATPVATATPTAEPIEIDIDSAEPSGTAAEDTGAASVKPTGPIKKKRNFGY